MFRDKKVVVVMPAYNAARTLKRTYDEVMDQGMVNLVIVVDDASRDETTAVARSLPNTIVHKHEVNAGYGANQKTCYRLAQGRRGHRDNGPSRLPIHAAAHPGDGGHDRFGALSVCAGLAASLAGTPCGAGCLSGSTSSTAS